MVSLNGMTQPRNRISNAVNNQKYNLINFLPIVLFNQFKLFFNFFQLVINLSQFIPILKVGFLFTYIAPLVMVILFTIIKEAYYDFKLFRRDQESNSAIYKYS
jgi:phospholipid-translocating ATPase